MASLAQNAQGLARPIRMEVVTPIAGADLGRTLDDDDGSGSDFPMANL